MFQRQKRVMCLVRSQRINVLGFQTAARLGRKIQGKNDVRWFWGIRKGEVSCPNSLDLSLMKLPQDTLTLLLAHVVTTKNKHKFNQFLPGTMILRKLQKGQFPKLRNFKRFGNELYINTIKNVGLASVHGEKNFLIQKTFLKRDYKCNSNMPVFSPVDLTQPL